MMQQISVSTYSLREQLGPLRFELTTPAGDDLTIEMPYPRLLDLSDFPLRARDAFGVDAIECVAFQFEGLEDPELDRFAQALVGSGVQLRNAAIDAGDLLEPDLEGRTADIDLLKRWIDRFATMGSQFVRVNPGSAFAPHQGDGMPDSLVGALIELGEHANSRGTRLLVENHGGPSSNPDWMHGLLDAVGWDSLGLLLDLGNFDVLTGALMGAGLGETSGGLAPLVELLDLEPLYKGITSLAQHAELVHVKVHEVDDAGALRAVDLERAFSILRDSGYRGPLTVEYEGIGGDPWEKTRHIVDVVRSLVAEPGQVGDARPLRHPRASTSA